MVEISAHRPLSEDLSKVRQFADRQGGVAVVRVGLGACTRGRAATAGTADTCPRRGYKRQAIGKANAGHINLTSGGARNLGHLSGEFV